MTRSWRPGPSGLLASTQAGGSLALASTAWMVSGLTPSPLLNSLLPALGALPLLLGIHRTPKGYGLQLTAVLLLIGVSVGGAWMAFDPSLLLVGCFAAVLLFGLGQEISTLPLQRRLLSKGVSSMQGLRRGQDVGALVGNLLAALLVPGLRQFLPALLLLLPMTRVAAERPIDQQAERPSTQTKRLPLDPTCMLQGLVIGALFALLALWVRQIDGGKCFDFAMVLAAYGLGRTGMALLPGMHQTLRYLLIGALLLISQASLPPVLAVLLFLPIGALVAASDGALVDQLMHLGDAPLRWQILFRSSAIGGVVGSLGLGLICQLLSLSIALPLVMAGFLLLAATQFRTTPASPQP
ncbi:MAG: hypothetical protein ACPHGV_09775 [Synechococcus sp.]